MVIEFGRSEANPTSLKPALCSLYGRQGSEDMIAAVDIDDFARDTPSERADEKERGVADFSLLGSPAKRRTLLVMFHHLSDP